MKLIEDIEIIDLGVYIKSTKIFAIADLHLGYEESLNNKGVMLPAHQFSDIKKRLEFIFETLAKENKSVKTILILGDLRHELGSAGLQEFRQVRALTAYLKTKCEKLILTRGNHETIHKYIEKMINVCDNYSCKGILFLHGDKIPEKIKENVIITGHVHPAIKLSDEFASERLKCFIAGKWKGKRLIVLPSFNPLKEGVDVLFEKIKSPFIKNLSGFEVFAVAEPGKVLCFGKVKQNRK
ncbi:MAG: metallophosphoesterase [Nanoarchaeota archaeon]